MTDEEREEWKDDCDWKSAFYEAAHNSYGPDLFADDRGPIENVKRVVAAEEGENDADSWLAIVEWAGPEGDYAVMEAGCDYTGWDCQASGVIDFYASEGIAMASLTPEQARRLGVPHDADRPVN